MELKKFWRKIVSGREERTKTPQMNQFKIRDQNLLHLGFKFKITRTGTSKEDLLKMQLKMELNTGDKKREAAKRLTASFVVNPLKSTIKCRICEKWVLKNCANLEETICFMNESFVLPKKSKYRMTLSFK